MKTSRFRATGGSGGLLAVALLGAIVVQAGAPADSVRAGETECRWATGPIKIDGRADEKAWQAAAVITPFSAHWRKQPAQTATRARLLWDADAIYFFADLEDHDLYADITEHDGMTWYNDVFELFFKPAEDKTGYYELQVNAANTTLDMFLPSRGSGGYRRWAKAHPFHLESAVLLRGTLNNEADHDQGWSVEGKIPWRDFAPTGGRPAAGQAWRFALCRYDYSSDLPEEDLTSSAPLTQPNYHRYEDYGVLRFVGGAKN